MCPPCQNYLKVACRRMVKSTLFICFSCPIFAPALTGNKTTKQITAYGHWESCFTSTLKLVLKCCITYFNVFNHGARFQIKGTFSKVHRRQKFKPILYLFIPLLFIVGIRYNEATFAALIYGGCKFAVFCRCVSSVRFTRSFIVFRAIQTTFAGVQLHIKTV